MKALVIRAGSGMERVDLEESSEGSSDGIRALIGDGFSSAFSVRLYGRRIFIWCDDEGAYKTDLPFSVVLGDSVYRDRYPMRGPLVITACDEMGETVPLDERDYQAIRLDPPWPKWLWPGADGFMGPVPPATIEGVPVLNIEEQP